MSKNININNKDFKALFYNEETKKGFEVFSTYDVNSLNNKLNDIIKSSEIKDVLKKLSPLTRIMSLVFAIEGTNKLDCDLDHQMNAIAYISLLDLANDFNLGIISKDEFKIIVKDVLPNSDEVIQNSYNLLLS